MDSSLNMFPMSISASGEKWDKKWCQQEVGTDAEPPLSDPTYEHMYSHFHKTIYQPLAHCHTCVGSAFPLQPAVFAHTLAPSRFTSHEQRSRCAVPSSYLRIYEFICVGEVTLLWWFTVWRSRPLSQLPVLSVAGLISVTTGQAVVTATKPFTDLIGRVGEQQVATPTNVQVAVRNQRRGVWGVKVVQAHSQKHRSTHASISISHWCIKSQM